MPGGGGGGGEATLARLTLEMRHVLALAQQQPSSVCSYSLAVREVVRVAQST